MADGSIIIDTQLNNKGFKDGLSGLKGLADKGLGGLKDLAGGVAKALAAVGAALATAAGFAIKAGIEFESAFAGVRKTVDASEQELAKLEQSIRGMAKEMPQSAAAIAGVAEAAGQLGIEVKNIDSFTKTMVQLGDATNMASEEAATSLARLANITGMSQNDFDKLGSTIVALGNNLATTESEITAMGLRLAGAGAQIGLSEAQIMGFAGALSSVGIEAEAGGSAFSKVMVDMQLAVETGGKSLKNFAKVAGMSTDDFSKMFKEDASSAILAFIKGLGSAEERGVSAIKVLDDMGISEVRLRDSLLRASGATETFNKSLSLANTAWEENTALTKEAETRYATMESQIGILKNKLTDLGITFYQDVRNPMADVVKEANNMLDQLAEAFDKNGLEGLVSTLGDVLAQVVVNIAEVAPKMIDSATNLINSFIGGLQTNMPAIANAAIDMGMALIRGIGDIIPRLLTLGVDIIKALGKGIEDNVGEIIDNAITIIDSLVQGIYDSLPYLLDASLAIIVELARGLGEYLPELIPKATEIIINLVQYILDNLPKIVECATEIIKGLAQGLIDAIPVLAEAAPELITAFADALVESIPIVIEAGGEIAEELANSLMEVDWFSIGGDIVKEMGKGIAKTGLSHFGILGKLAQGVLDDSVDGFKQAHSEYMDLTGAEISSVHGSYGGGGKQFSTGRGPISNNYYDESMGIEDRTAEEMAQAIKTVGDKMQATLQGEVGPQLEEATGDMLGSLADETVDASAKYAKLMQDKEVQYSEEYLQLKEAIDEQEKRQMEEELAEKEAIGISGVQKAYNSYIATEKAKIIEKEKVISALETKLDKQNKALQIASSTKDLQGAYKALTALELELVEGTDQEVSAKKLEDIAKMADEEKEEALNALAEANEEKLSLMLDGLEGEKDLLEQHKSNYESVYSGMVSAYESAYQTISNKQETLSNKFKAFGDLFDKFTEQNADGENVEYMKLGDLGEDVNQLKLLSAGLDKLRERGVSQDYLDNYLSSNTVGESLDFTELLLKQTGNALNEHLAMWEEKNRLADELAGNFYKSEYDNLKTEFSDKISNELGLMPDEAEQIGKDTATKLAEGLRSGVDTVRSAVSELVAQMQATVASEMGLTQQVALSPQNATQQKNDSDWTNKLSTSLANALSSTSNTNKSTQPISITMEVDGREVAKATVPYLPEQSIRQGVSLK